jgi:hypothetical protein
MPFFIKVTAQYGYVPAGAGGAVLGQRQADFPGSGAAGANVSPVFIAQSAMDYVGEAVPGGDAATSGNFQTALNAAATDLYTQLTTAGDVPGFTSGTLLAQIQAWPTGTP